MEEPRLLFRPCRPPERHPEAFSRRLKRRRIRGGLGRLAAQVLQVHVKDSFFGGVENMDHNKKKVLVTIPVTQEQRNWLVEKGAGRCELTFLPAA